MRKLLSAMALSLGLVLTACGQDVENQLGTVKITIEGLPAGVKGAVKVTNTTTKAEKILDVSGKTAFPVGSYAVTASPIKIAGSDYIIGLSKNSITVESRKEVDLTATYEKSASLTLTILGLPTGASAGVTVKGKSPSTFSKTVNATETLTLLKPGDYEISAPVITSGTDSYTAANTPVTVTLGAGDAKESAINFSKVDTTVKGSLNFNVSGLAAATSPKITVTGASLTTPLVVSTNTATLDNLSIGTYTITSEEVFSSTFSTDSLVFVPKEVIKEISITNATPVAINVQYEEQFSYASFNTSFANAAANNLKQGGYFYTFAGPNSSSATYTRDQKIATIEYVNNSYYGFDVRPFVTTDGSAAVPQDLRTYTKIRLKLGSITAVTSINITMMGNPDDDANFLDAQYTAVLNPISLTDYILDLSQFAPKSGTVNNQTVTGLAIADVMKALRQIRVQGNGPSGTYQVGSIYLIK